MAKQSLKSVPRVLVVDTGYLLELMAVPGHSSPKTVQEIRKRFEDAVKQDCRVYVPVPCIFEIANHIAQVNNGNRRRCLAKQLSDTIRSSVEKGMPWNLVPSGGLEELAHLCKEFADNYVLRSIGLTDTSVIDQALYLKKQYKNKGWKVHIWTTDKELKTQEPDSEKDAFLG